MRTAFVQQPFDASGRPQNLGSILTAELLTGAYGAARFAVAFATSGGTSRMFESLSALRASGGTVDVYLGVANGITSVQAAEQLLAAGANVFAFDPGGVLYHPKVYWLDGGDSSLVAVGSSNLTCEGLFRNFEANAVTSYSADDEDRAQLATVADWFAWLQAFSLNCRPVAPGALAALVSSGDLIDERASPQPQVIARPRAASGASGAATVPAIGVPPAPAPHPALHSPRTISASAAATTGVGSNSQFFAMSLSAFDASHRPGVPGTPELSLPDDVVAFFPPVSAQGRQYPDAYFDVVLNHPSGIATVQNYRIWQRPPGSASGHADWRLRVDHVTIEQTTPGGGDILLFEQLPPGSSPPYEVWVVTPADSRYQALLARCTSQAGGGGVAGTKQYGLF